MVRRDDTRFTARKAIDFLITIRVADLLTGICFVVARQTFQGGANGVPLSIDLFKGPDIFKGIIFMMITLTLQSMRIRDIGWIRSASGEPRRPDPAPRGGSNSGAAERLARVSGELGRRTL